MKINVNLLLLGNTKEKIDMHVGEVHIGESNDEMLLDITLDKKLSFKKHIQTFCKIASQRLQSKQSPRN